MKLNMYVVMGVEQDATTVEIQGAYNRLRDEYQSKYDQSDPSVQLVLYNLNEAKYTLLSPERRHKHDEWLANSNLQDRLVSEEITLQKYDEIKNRKHDELLANSNRQEMPVSEETSFQEYDEIISQLVSIGVSDETISRKEIEELPKVLSSNERIEQLIIGSIEGDHYGLSGVIVATDYRLAYVEKNPFGITVEGIPYDKIMSIRHDYRPDAIDVAEMGEIVVSLSDGKIIILSHAEIVEEFAKFVHSKISADLKVYKTKAKRRPKPEMIVADEKSELTIACPVCGCKQITSQKRGFSPLKAVGGVLFIPGGLLWGFHGRNKIIITCLKCGHQWAP